MKKIVFGMFIGIILSCSKTQPNETNVKITRDSSVLIPNSSKDISSTEVSTNTKDDSLNLHCIDKFYFGKLHSAKFGSLILGNSTFTGSTFGNYYYEFDSPCKDDGFLFLPTTKERYNELNEIISHKYGKPKKINLKSKYEGIASRKRITKFEYVWDTKYKKIYLGNSSDNNRILTLKLKIVNKMLEKAKLDHDKVEKDSLISSESNKL